MIIMIYWGRIVSNYTSQFSSWIFYLHCKNFLNKFFPKVASVLILHLYIFNSKYVGQMKENHTDSKEFKIKSISSNSSCGLERDLNASWKRSAKGKVSCQCCHLWAVAAIKTTRPVLATCHCRPFSRSCKASVYF